MGKKIKIKKVKTEAELEREKELKEREAAGIQDDFQAKGFELASWAQENKGLVYGLIAFVVLGGIGATFVSSNKASEAAKNVEVFALAQEAASGIDAESTEAIDAALDKLNAASQKSESAEAEAIVSLYRGTLLLKKKDAKAAQAEFKNYLAKTNESDPLYFLGLDGLSVLAEERGSVDDALAALNEWVKLPSGVDQGSALLRIAELNLAKGDNDRAKTPATKILKEYTDPALVKKAENILNQIGVDLDTIERAKGDA